MLTKQESDKLWELIEPARTAMLTTWNGDMLAARPMAHANEEFAGTLYYFTDLTSEKIDEIKRYPSVNLSYVDGTDVYVSLSGNAGTTRDPELIEKLWNPYVAAWFPKGKDTPDLGLLTVIPTKGEYWDSEESKMIELFKIAKANITGNEPEFVTNEKIG